MLFGYTTLFVAFVLSAVAAYYSVLGLVAIFSAAAIPVIVMGGALETGKVIAAMWLHRNWNRAPWTYKAYLLPSLLALMLLTSMGTFGYLSKAHSDQSLVSGDVQSKIAIYDEKIRISRENIDANRRALKQLDEAVDQIMGRSTTEQGAERSVQIRRQQGPERQRLLREIEAEQKKISSLNEERAPIAAEVRKVEAEVGPIKYIAALIYGDNPETNLLESAVRWVIILIVVVFDPLAIVLILAGTRHLEWERAERAARLHETQKVPAESDTAPDVETEEQPIKQEQALPAYLAKVGNWFKWRPFEKKPLPAYLTRPWIDHVDKSVPHQVYVPEVLQVNVEPNLTTVVSNTVTVVEPQQDPNKKKNKVQLIGENYLALDGKAIALSVVKDLYPEMYSEAQAILAQRLKVKEQQEAAEAGEATFGEKFPNNVKKGHLHVHTGTLPSKLYKFNGVKWIEVDKKVSDSYTHNEAYIKYLISKLDTKELSIVDLTDYEQEMIRDFLSKNGQ
jgi:hypothetical protein